MSLKTEAYQEQVLRWPRQGRVILAQYDTESIIVYQAYRPAIGGFAARNGWFGGEFSLGRMTWIKPNFLWMMFRSGWAGKEGQDVVLAVRMRRERFDAILAEAVHAQFEATVYASHDAWRTRVSESEVRLQWDPDHDPWGRPLERRAIQLGWRGAAAVGYARAWILGIEDITPFVYEQRERLATLGAESLIVPREEPYPVRDPDVVRRLGIDCP